MAKNKPKNQEHDLKTELHKESKKPNPSPIINKKAQQKQNKKKPNEERKNRQKAEAQRFSDSVQKLQKSIKLSGHSIFQAVDVKAITKINKKSINRKIIVQPVLKECNIGYVKKIEFRYNSNWTVDEVKKDIANAILKNEYELVLAAETELMIKQKLFNMVKSRHDVSVSSDFIPMMKGNEGYFWLSRSVLHGHNEKGEPVNHHLTNVYIKNDGKIIFRYYQTAFEMTNGSVKNITAGTQKKLAAFVNENDSAIRKCMHTEISPDSELRLTITVRDSVAGLHAVLIFDDKKFKKNMTGIVDSEAFKLWVEVVSDEYHKEKREFIEMVQSKQRRLKIYGSLLHLTILRTIAKREGFDWPDEYEYEWIENIVEKEIVKVQAGKVSSMLSMSGVVTAVNDLVSCGLLKKIDEKIFTGKGKDGRYGEEFLPNAKNTILKPGDDYVIFAKLPFERKYTISEFTDIDWIDWLKNRQNEELNDKTANTEMMNILEHSIVVLSCKDEMRLFLSERPQSWCDYIETMEEMTEDKGEKEYWKTVQSMIR